MQTISCYNNASKPKFLTRVTSKVPFLPILLRIFCHLLCGTTEITSYVAINCSKVTVFFFIGNFNIINCERAWTITIFTARNIHLFCLHCQIDLLSIAQNSMNFEAVFRKTIKRRSRKFIWKALGCPILCAIGIAVMHSIKKCNEQDQYSTPISRKITFLQTMKSFLLSTVKIDFKNKGSYDSDAIHFQIWKREMPLPFPGFTFLFSIVSSTAESNPEVR